MTMTHSKNFKTIKTYYVRKLWSIEKIHACVPKQITEEEYEEITGFEYPNVE